MVPEYSPIFISLMLLLFFNYMQLDHAHAMYLHSVHQGCCNDSCNGN